MTPKRVVAFIVGSSVFCLILLPWAAAKSPADLLNGGDPRESLGVPDGRATDPRCHVCPDHVCAASAFPTNRRTGGWACS